jgi:hypothetical protein
LCALCCDYESIGSALTDGAPAHRLSACEPTCAVRRDGAGYVLADGLHDPIVATVIGRVHNSAMRAQLEKLLLRLRSKLDSTCATVQWPCACVRAFSA